MIIAAAIRHKGEIYALPAPARHHDIIRHINKKTGDVVPGNSKQGFIDSDRGFVSRRDARYLAIVQEQIKEAGHPTELFSEDLW